MKIMILANDALAVGIEQATWELAHCAARRGHEVVMGSVSALSVSPSGEPGAYVHAVPGLADSAQALAQMKASAARRCVLGAGDLLWLRTNPARDAARLRAHNAALTWASMVEREGAVVLNAPRGLRMASDKLYLTSLPASVRPTTLVTSSVEEVEAFLDGLDGPGVLKPLSGTHGRDVFLVKPGDRSNLGQIMDVLTREGGYAMAQSYVPEASRGDVRLLLVEGRLVELGGHAAAVRRVPPPKGFRSNVHAGGRAEKVDLTASMRAVVEAIGDRLREDGLFLVGVDLIGAKIVEINAFSPGGLGDASLFSGQNFVQAVVEAAEQKVKLFV